MSASFTVSGKGAQAPGNEGNATPRFDIQSRPVTDLTNRDELLHVGAGNESFNVLEVTKTQVKARSGTVGSPGLSFIDDTDSGIRRVSANTIALITNGTDRLSANASGLITIPGASLTTGIGTFTAQTVHNGGIDVNGSADISTFLDVGTIVNSGLGSASAPAYSFQSDSDTGMFRLGANVLSFATAGTERLQINSDGRLRNGDGNAATPAYTFLSDNTLGMFREGSTLLGFSVNGIKGLSVTQTSVRAQSEFFFDDGSATSGFISITSAKTQMTINGTPVLEFEPASVRFIGASVFMFNIPNGAGSGQRDVQMNTGTGQLVTETVSSKRYKENIRPIEQDGSKLLDIELVTFDYKDSYLKDKCIDSTPKHNYHGAIAEQVNKLFPEYTFKDEKGIVEGVNYSKFTVPLIDLCQKQQKQIDSLTKDMKILKRKLLKK